LKKNKEEEEVEEEDSTGPDLKGEQDATPWEDLVLQMFLATTKEDTPFSNALEANTLGVLTTSTIELLS